MFSNNPFNMHRAIDQVLNEDPAHYAAIARNNAAKQAERDKTDGGKDKARRDKAKANLAKAKPVYAKGDKSFASNIGVKESKFLIPEEIPANERTAFHGAAAGAAKDGKTSFSFSGKKYPVTMDKGIAKNIADQKESIGQTAGDHGYYHLQKAKELAKKYGHDYDKLPQYDRGHDKHKDHYDSRAKKESVKKEAVVKTGYGIRNKVSDMPGVDYSWRDKYKNAIVSKDTLKKVRAKSDAKRAEYRKKMGMKEDVMNEEFSKTNKASMTIKHGYDEGDGPDNKKFAKYINKNTGATVKHHKDGSTMSFHGSDHQIHKALQHHHSDDKKGLGDLNYHKKGKTDSPDHVDGQHSYKAEGTTFRERLISIFENDKASHYKSATKPETMDDQLKGAGAKQMKTDLTGGDTKAADMEKQSHVDAAKAGRAGPGTKARTNDNKKGDKKAMASATPITDPTAKIVKTEAYGISGNKISSSLLDAIAMVEDMDKVHTVDIDHMTGKTGSHEKKHSITLKKNGSTSSSSLATDATGTKANLQKYLKKHYDGDHKEAHPEIYK